METLTPATTTPVKNERQKRLEERNQLIVIRYWWLTEHHLRKSEYAAQRIGQEFCLAPRTVMNLVWERWRTFLELKGAPPKVSALKRQYPSYTWTD